MKNNRAIKVFIIGIVISTLAALPFILDPTLTPRHLSLAICLVLGLLFLSRQRFTAVVKADGILLAYSAYTLFCCLSVFWAHTRSEAIFESSKQLLGFFVFLFTYYALKKDADDFLPSLLKISVVLFVFSLLIGLMQLSDMANFSRESIYTLDGLHGHKNLFSSFLFLNLFFLLLGSYRLENPWKMAARACAIINVAILLLLKTKAVWLGLGCVIFLFIILSVFYLRPKAPKLRIKPALLLVTALLCLNVFFLGFLQPLIQKSMQYASQGAAAAPGKENDNPIRLEQERLVLWDKTFHLIRQKPLLGVGMGNWQIYLPDATLSGLWRGEDLNFTFQRPHNDFLWILSETGIIGFNLFLLFLCSVLFSLLRALRFIAGNRAGAFDLLFCAVFITGYYVISFFDFPKERIEHLMWINIILGISYYYIRLYVPLKNYRNIGLGKPQLAVATVLLAIVLLTGFMRLRGESFTRRMYNYKGSGQLLKISDSGNSAMSFAYSIDPTSVPLHWYTGNANATLGRYEEAHKDFLKAYRYNPYNRNVLNDLASSYVFINNVILAKKYYEEAARISPRFDDPKLNLAAMYINASDYTTANTWLQSIFHDSERRSNYQRIVDLNK